MSSSKKLATQSFTVAVATSVLFAGSFVAGKMAVGALGPLTVTLYRYVVALGFLFVLRLFTRQARPALRLHDIPTLVFLGLFGIIGYHYFFFSSLSFTEVTNTAIINAASPVVTAVLAATFIGERLTSRQYVGIGVSVVGTLFLVSNGRPQALLDSGLNRGDGLMLLAVCSWAAYAVLVRRVRGRYSSLDLTTGAMFFGVVALLPLTVVLEPPLGLSMSWPVAVAILYMGVAASGLGYLLYNRSISSAGPTTTAGIVYGLVPVWVATLSFALFSEPVTMVMVVSCLCVVTGLRLLLTPPAKVQPGGDRT